MLVTECGVVGDGKTLNTTAIQAALDTVGAAGGGTVTLPPGVYLSGSEGSEAEDVQALQYLA